jgi:hypothetical protein
MVLCGELVFLTTTAAAATWKPMISEPAVVKWLIAGSLPNARPGEENDGLRGLDLFTRDSNRPATVALRCQGPFV